MTGRVKWFDVTKGYGFIIAEGCDTDVLLHGNVLRGFGQNSVANNARIEVVVQNSERGCQAAEILSIAPPDVQSGLDSMRGFLGPDVTADAGQGLRPARVTWFDRAKGFGFANAFGSAEDVFLHIEVLQACGLSEVQPGEAIAIRTARGPRGRMAWDIKVWDQAIGTAEDPGKAPAQEPEE